MKDIFKKINKFILDTLFPVHCLYCNKETFWICQDCSKKISFLTEHVCGVCEKVITPDGQTCIPCKKKSPLDGLLPAVSYSDHAISQAVHLFKYRFVQDLSMGLGNLLIEKISKTDFPLPDIIIPVPLHPKRLRWRGFNQSDLLAQYIGKNLLPHCKIFVGENILIRNRYTSPQMEIKKYSDRRQNISGAFSTTQPEKIAGKTILLVDDIATTGSTIIECAKALKDAGAKYVFAAVIARQETKKQES